MHSHIRANICTNSYPLPYLYTKVATLFGTIKDKSTHSPAHGLVAIVPFVDLTPTTGATEYYMGT